MLKNFLLGVISIAVWVNFSNYTLAAEATKESAETNIYEEQLAQYAVDKQENIVLLDEQNNILNEFHSDGYVADFIYSGNYSEDSQIMLCTIADNNGKIQNITYDEEGTIDKVDIYYEEKYLGTKDFSCSEYEMTEIMPYASYSAFYVTHSNGKTVNMSNLISDKLFVRQSTSATQKDIQDLFDEKNSPLKNNIVIYKKNSSGNVYNTGITVTPAKVIYDASVEYSVSPKVILATLQKESSLVSSYHADGSLSSSCFYFCMGAGSSSSSSTTGFQNQIDLGTSTLQKWYEDGNNNYAFPYYYSHSGFRGYKGYNSSGYSTAIWCDNAATYSLYKYTPYTCASNSNTHSANVLFLEIYNGALLSDFPS